MRRRVAVLAAALLPLVAFACGSDTAPAHVDAAPGAALLAQAAARTIAFETGRAELTATVTRAGEEPITITATGAFDTAHTAASATLDLSGLAGLAGPDADPLAKALLKLAGSVDAVAQGTTLYVRPGILGQLLGGTNGKPWVRIDASAFAPDGSGPSPFTAETIDPTELLDRLRQAGGTVTEQGREDIRGAATTHYRTSYALDAPATGAGVLDVWIDDDGIVRQIRGAVSATEGSLIATATLFDLGSPVTITVPPADQVTDGKDLVGLLEGWATKPR
jgi:hypothetical protein